jgi:hypothetical protein
MYSGMHFIDDTFTFYWQTYRYDTGAELDATGTPAYEVYEQETGTAILSGSLAKLNDAGTVGLYSEQITLSAANGFEVGKMYLVRGTATVNAVAIAENLAVFRIMPDLQKAIRLLVNETSRATSGTVTVRNDGDTADLYTMTVTQSSGVVTKGAITNA